MTRAPPPTRSSTIGGRLARKCPARARVTSAIGDPAPPTGDSPPESDEPAAVAYQSGMTLEDMEREVIHAVLNSVGWNRREAAEKLGIGERTLYRKVRKYGLEED